MTIEQFQKNPQLSGGLAELLRTNTTLQMALAVCEKASPANGGVTNIGKEPHVVHFQHGVDRGYNLFPQVLRLLAEAPAATEPVESTYENPVMEETEAANA